VTINLMCLRASQINGRAVCLDMLIRATKKAVYHVPVTRRHSVIALNRPTKALAAQTRPHLPLRARVGDGRAGSPACGALPDAGKALAGGWLSFGRVRVSGA